MATAKAKRVFTYNLPESGGAETIQHKTETNSVVIIGANGSGKSRLGAWMEAKDRIHFHRIGAQRSISWSENIAPQSLEISQNLVLYGGMHTTAQMVEHNFHGWKDGKITTERRDVEAVLSAIFAKRTLQLENFDERFKKDDTLKRERNIIDDITDIWSNVFPHRSIKFEDMKIIASVDGSSYNGAEMSDGERVAIYLIAQALLVPDNRNIIVDEPETHLHRSIMNRLWQLIENKRPDCLFIYITHDTQFAANHKHSDRIWVQEYDGSTWKWELIPQAEFPEQLLLDILGNRKPVIFVEGTNDSYDTKLYSAVYKDFYIIPCGGCVEVISRTKAFRRLQNEYPQLHHVEAYGIIDRDFRSEIEIGALKASGIHTFDVAEVENLFVVDELLTLINQHQGFSDTSRIDNVKKYIEDRFCQQIASQICEATVSEIKYRLSGIKVSKKPDEWRASFKAEVDVIDYNAIHDEIATQYERAKENKEYKQILRLFNYKGVSKSVGRFLGIIDKDYCELVLRLINGEMHTEITSALLNYLPSERDLSICNVKDGDVPTPEGFKAR